MMAAGKRSRYREGNVRRFHSHRKRQRRCCTGVRPQLSPARRSRGGRGGGRLAGGGGAALGCARAAIPVERGRRRGDRRTRRAVRGDGRGQGAGADDRGARRGDADPGLAERHGAYAPFLRCWRHPLPVQPDVLGGDGACDPLRPAACRAALRVERAGEGAARAARLAIRSWDALAAAHAGAGEPAGPARSARHADLLRQARSGGPGAGAQCAAPPERGHALHCLRA